jgi:glucose/arabinose dehydrogenase
MIPRAKTTAALIPSIAVIATLVLALALAMSVPGTRVPGSSPRATLAAGSASPATLISIPPPTSPQVSAEPAATPPGSASPGPSGSGLINSVIPTSTPGPGASAIAPSIPDPTPVPTPRPTPAPTPKANPTPNPAPAPTPKISLRFDRVAGGLSKPVFVTGAGDGSGRLFVLEQGGRIRIVKNGTLAALPFLDVSTLVQAGGERGLLGLAFHPDYASDGRLYVFYTDNSPDNALTVVQYRVSVVNPDLADPASAKVLLTIPHNQAANHNGGMLAFGPDSRLYVGTGDGGGSGGQFGYSQNLGSLLAKILRLDVDHPANGKPYGTSGNPFTGVAGARPEIWAYGLRNPWRFSFDRTAGDLWIGDVGQAQWEEIDHANSGIGGQDYGWNKMEGAHCYSPASGCDKTGLTMPVAEYGHALGCAVVGGYAYRGVASPAMRGKYLFGDSCSGRVWALNAGSDTGQTPSQLAATGKSISSFGQGDNGELYLLDLSAGELLHISGS